MPLAFPAVLDHLETIAPRRFAESWDNVGLLIEPADREWPVARALVTIDLTDDVLDEARAFGAELVVAYHPPIFKGLKRLTRDTPAARVALAAARAGIGVYSPHTALDAAPGGVNDWLAEAIGEGAREPITQAFAPDAGGDFKLVVFVPRENADALRDALAEAGAGWIGAYSHCSFNLEGQGTFRGHEGTDPAVGASGRLETVREVRVEMVCARRALPAAAAAIARVHPYEEPAWDAYPLAPKPRAGAGMGRVVSLARPAALNAIVERVKRHLGLSHVRVAAANKHRTGARVACAAVSAGAGGALFESVADVDLLLTGEMRHHDVLDRNARGTSVVLCDHTNTERGYLPRLAARLETLAQGALEVRVSERDRDPLEIV
jgi:dinuclear metal center YbgI/SA1388 family protein